jgi:hypothetical protein
VDYLIPDVEGYERRSPGYQHPPDLEQDRAKLRDVDVHDRIEGYYTCKCRVRHLELRHVSHLEVETRIETLGHPDHLRGEIDADNGDALLMKIASDVPGTAAEVRHEALGRVIARGDDAFYAARRKIPTISAPPHPSTTVEEERGDPGGDILQARSYAEG